MFNTLGTSLRHNPNLHTIILDANPVRQISKREASSIKHVRNLSLRYTNMHDLHGTGESLSEMSSLRFLRFKYSNIPRIYNSSPLLRARYLHRQIIEDWKFDVDVEEKEVEKEVEKERRKKKREEKRRKKS